MNVLTATGTRVQVIPHRTHSASPPVSCGCTRPARCSICRTASTCAATDG